MTRNFPRLKTPPGACDCHMHVFDSRFPLAQNARRKEADAPVSAYRELQRQLGLERVVVVQPTAYGKDNGGELIRRAPERLVWATNWPHPLAREGAAPDDAVLLDLLLEWAPTEATRNRILADNPAQLYGFPAPAKHRTKEAAL